MYKQKSLTWFLTITLALVIGSCQKEKEPEKRGVFVSTSDVTNVILVPAGTITLTAGGDAAVVGDESVAERGVVWGTTAKPTTDNNKVAIGSGEGNFSSEISGFPYGDSFHVRAYVVSNGMTYYGNDIEFRAVIPPTELIKNGDFKLPDDNVKYTNLNDVPNWSTEEDPYYTGREYDPWKNSGCVYLNDFGNFYQAVEGEIPAVKSNYKIKFDANYVWTNWAPYAPKIYVTFSTFTDDPANRTPIGSVEIATVVDQPADASVNWKSYEANFSIPEASAAAGKKLAIEWSLENYKTESWGWSETWYDFDNISVLRSLE